MQSTKEQQGEKRKPFFFFLFKKAFLSEQCKEIEEINRLEISLRKLEIPRECFMQR